MCARSEFSADKACTIMKIAFHDKYDKLSGTAILDFKRPYKLDRFRYFQGGGVADNRHFTLMVLEGTLEPTDKTEHMRIHIGRLKTEVEWLRKAQGRHDEDVKRLPDQRQELRDVVGELRGSAAPMSYVSSHIDTAKLLK
jgi:hypothetical protein